MHDATSRVKLEGGIAVNVELATMHVLNRDASIPTFALFFLFFFHFTILFGPLQL